MRIDLIQQLQMACLVGQRMEGFGPDFDKSYTIVKTDPIPEGLRAGNILHPIFDGHGRLVKVVFEG